MLAEWWRGRTDTRDSILRAARVVAPIEAAKAAGLALSRLKHVDATITVDAMVIATAALLDAIVVTSDPDDFARLGAHFPAVVVLAT